MNRLVAIGAAAVLAAGTATAQMEVRGALLLDPDSSEESNVGLLAGVGLRPTDLMVVGLYGSFQETDRDLPNTMSRMYGLGGYVEVDLTEGYDVTPFVGLRAGLLDTSGPNYPTAFNVVGSAGAKYSLSDILVAAVSLSAHWSDEEFYDYERDGNSWDADQTDFTFDLGLRYLF